MKRGIRRNFLIWTGNNTVMVVTCKRIRAGHTAAMGETTNAYTTLLGTPFGNDHFGD
jgi:hypothetical protein